MIIKQLISKKLNGAAILGMSMDNPKKTKRMKPIHILTKAILFGIMDSIVIYKKLSCLSLLVVS